MAQSDVFKRYLEAGIAFTELTRARAEAIVKDLVKAGELPRKRAEDAIDDLVKQSRANTEALVELVQAQVREQLGALGIATKDDIARLEAKIAARPAAPAKKAAKKLVVAKAPVGASAKKAPAKKSAAKRAAKKA